MSSPILVVTCPSGKQAAHFLPLVYNKPDFPFRLRLAAHSQTSVNKLQQTYPKAEIVQTDLTSLSSCQALLNGSTAAIHIGPSLHSREKELGFNMIDAAVAETLRQGNLFKHFIFSSVLNTQHRQLMQHDLKSYIEERLMISPLQWTILKPTNFMDAYPVNYLKNMERPVLERRWKPEIPNSVIALRDVAEAMLRVVLEGEKHYYAEYPLCSTMPISDSEICVKIGEAIGKEIEVKTPDFYSGGVEKLMGFIFGDKQAEGMGLSAEGDLRGDICRDEAERLILFYNRRGLKGNPNVLRWLLGREPTTVEQWIQFQLEGNDALTSSAAIIRQATKQ